VLVSNVLSGTCSGDGKSQSFGWVLARCSLNMCSLYACNIYMCVLTQRADSVCAGADRLGMSVHHFALVAASKHMC
jgi:hypothetical protein